MDKMENKGTQDFMNVDSFSQLPFIRSVPTTSTREKGIRLFGKEVGASAITTTTTETDSTDVKDQTSACEEGNKDNGINGDSSSSSSRKFECHYCCRNFPTSQALGGHQNAHKRERQHAKRAHLQSALAHNCYSEARIYNHLMNYNRQAGSQAALSYPTWNTISSYNTINHPAPSYLAGIGNRNSSSSSSASAMMNSPSSSSSSSHYSHYHHQPLINGSPLALWRIPSVPTTLPAFNRDRPSHHHQLPLFSKDDIDRRTSLKVGDPSSSQKQLFVYETKPSVQDPVSLDLHL